MYNIMTVKMAWFIFTSSKTFTLRQKTFILKKGIRAANFLQRHLTQMFSYSFYVAIETKERILVQKT